MKKIKKLIFIIFLMCINIKTSYAAIKVIPSEISLGVDYSQNLVVYDTGSNNISWTSSNPNIVTVNNGKIVGVNKGEAYVKVTDGLSVALCKVKIIDNYVPVQSIKLSQSGGNLVLNDTIKLEPIISPINASNKTPTYISSNAGVASVDSNGNVTAKKIGTANISVLIENKVVIYKVNVVDRVLLQGISVQPAISLKTNGTAQLVVTFNPSDATDKTVSFSTSNPNVAVVSDSGLVRAKAPGTAIITVVSNDGWYEAASKITVTGNSTSQNPVTNQPTTSSQTNTNNNNIKLKSISLNKTTLSLNVNEEATLSVTYNPSNATDKSVTWKSSNTGVVTVSSDGKVKAVFQGTATITVTSNDGKYEAKCNVTVQDNSTNNNGSGNENNTTTEIRLKGIKLSQNRLDIKKGTENILDVIYTPDDATDKSVTWFSSNPEVATVTDGKIKALSIGNTTIRVTSANGYYQDKCDVYVYSDLPIEEIAFEKDTQTVYVGYTITLKTITTPENTLLENPVWTSSNEYVAMVDNGVVTAIDVGSVTITVSDEKNEIVASTIVEVIEKPLPKLEVTIKGYDLNFDPDTKNYKLTIGNESTLDIKTNYEEENVVIAGNHDLKNNSIITITVKGNGDTKNTYVISIKKKGVGIIYFIVIASILLTVNLIRIILNSAKKKFKKKK